MLEKTEDKRRRGRQRVRWLDGITDSKDMSLSRFLEIEKGLNAQHAATHGAAKSQTRLGGWTAAVWQQKKYVFGRELGHKGVALTKGISALVRDMGNFPFFLPLMWGL